MLRKFSFLKKSDSPNKTTGVIVVLNGTSCAGKSTLKSDLKDIFGKLDTWHYIECDEIEDRLKEQRLPENISPEEQARLMTLTQARDLALQHHNVIVDISLFNAEELLILEGTKLLLVLVYSPLHILLERDKKRTEDLHRSLPRQLAARKFIIQTYSNLYQSTKDDNYIDVLDIGILENAMYDISEKSFEIIEKSKQKFFSNETKIKIASQFPHNIVINTETENKKTYLAKINQLIFSLQNHEDVIVEKKYVTLDK